MCMFVYVCACVGCVSTSVFLWLVKNYLILLYSNNCLLHEWDNIIQYENNSNSMDSLNGH